MTKLIKLGSGTIFAFFNVGASHAALHFSLDLAAPENSSFQASASPLCFKL